MLIDLVTVPGSGSLLKELQPSVQIIVATVKPGSYNHAVPATRRSGPVKPLSTHWAAEIRLALKGVQHGDCDGSGRDDNARDERPRYGHAHARRSNGDAAGSELDDGAALHAQDGKVHGGNEDRLLLRGQGGLRHGAEPLPHARRRHV